MSKTLKCQNCGDEFDEDLELIKKCPECGLYLCSTCWGYNPDADICEDCENDDSNPRR